MSVALAGAVAWSSAARADAPGPDDTPPAKAPPPAKPRAKAPPPSAGPPAPAQPPSASPPSTSPPSTSPPSTSPPSASPPSAGPPATAPPGDIPPGATPPGGAPPSASPPSATPPAATPPGDLPPSETPPTEPPGEAPSEPSEPSEPEGEDAEAGSDDAEPAETEAAPVPDAAWDAMIDKDVTVEIGDGTKIAGKLLSHDEDNAVIAQPDGRIVAVPKADAVGLKLGLETAPPKTPAPPPARTTPKPPAEKFHRLGLFTSHGVTYSHFRKADVDLAVAGAAYALDGAVGYNFNARFGLYAILGGNVGARPDSGRWRGNTGKIAMGFLMKRKYVAFIPGIGIAFTDLNGPDRFRGAGLAIPIKLMGLIPLKKPEGMFVGIGLMWDFGIVRGGLMSNAIGGQVTVGRW